MCFLFNFIISLINIIEFNLYIIPIILIIYSMLQILLITYTNKVKIAIKNQKLLNYFYFSIIFSTYCILTEILIYNY